MHEYYRNIIPKLKKENEGYLHFVKAEMEQKTGKPYRKVWQEIWDFYERNLLEHFPYIGGDKVSGTKNLHRRLQLCGDGRGTQTLRRIPGGFGASDGAGL